MNERRVTEGGRELRRYLTEIGLSVPAFCELHKLDRIQVQRVLNGSHYKRISVDFADTIQHATEGRIHPAMFRSSTAVPVNDSDSAESGEHAAVDVKHTGT